jgi:hypothetical protein
MPSRIDMTITFAGVNRRSLLFASLLLNSPPAAARKQHEVYRLRTGDADIDLTIEFQDRYTSRGFWFREETSGERYCLSPEGEAGRNCVTNFRGSLAIARYHVKGRRQQPPAKLRELVRTIDHDSRVPRRPQFERTIALRHGLGSDLQAFGYEPDPREVPARDEHGPWYLYRQDLFLEPRPDPFIILFWKHALASIRLLDLIPGDGTWLEKK